VNGLRSLFIYSLHILEIFRKLKIMFLTFHITLRIYKLECILLHNTFPSATVFSFYIFTFLMFRKLNKPQLTKIKQQHFIGIRAFDSRLYLDISRSFK
jgi:hypothetical protein